MELLAGLFLGGLLFGGSSETTIVSNQQKPENKRGQPTFIAFNKKTMEALFTCSQCFGTGKEEYHNGSICEYMEDHSYCYRTCMICNGNKVMKIKIRKDIWAKALKLAKAKKSLHHTTK